MNIREEYELVCRVFRMVDNHRIDRKTAHTLLRDVHGRVFLNACRSVPVPPGYTWRSTERYLHFRRGQMYSRVVHRYLEVG